MNNFDVYPQVSNNDKLGRKGIRVVKDIVEGTFGWIFRTQDVADVGIDAYIEVVDGSDAIGRIIALQVKCGESYFRETVETGFVFRPQNKHVNYWINHSLPVIVVVCDPNTCNCWWIEVVKNNLINTDKGWKSIIPFGQHFDETMKHVLFQIAGRSFEDRIKDRYKNRLWLAPIIEDRNILEIIYRGGVLMGFRLVTGIDYRLLVFSQDYVLYQSDSFYDLEMWKNILDSAGVEGWEIEEALEKADREIIN